MKRILIIAAIALVVLVGGWSALWFANKSTAEEQVRAALVELERAGLNNKFEAVSVAGFPFSYRGEVTNLTFETGDAEIAFPTVSAGVSVTDTNTVVFGFPERFEVRQKGGSGRVAILSDDLSASVTLAGDNAYDLALAANALTIEPDMPGPKAKIEIKDLATSGEMRANPAENQVRLALSVAAAEAVTTMDAGLAGPDASNVRLGGLSAAVDGSLDAMSTKLAADRVSMDFGDLWTMEALKPSYSMSVKAKEQFNAAPMTGVSDFGEALLAFMQMAGMGLADGGDLDFQWTMTSLKGSGAIEGQPSTADIGALKFSVGVGSKRVGMDLDIENLLIDGRAPDGNEFYYQLKGVDTTIETTPADSFDFSGVMLAAGRGPDAIGEAISAEIGQQILKGGAFEYSEKSGGGTVRISAPPGPGAPFGKFEYGVGPGSNRIAVNPDEAVLKASVNAVAFKLSEGLEASGALKSMEIDFKAPMRASPSEQKATLLISLNDLSLDDNVWAMIDPGAALTREVKGLKIAADAGLTIQRDILSPESDLFNPINPPALPGKLTIQDSFLDMLGLRADLSGEMMVLPIPAGQMALALKGWPQFFQSVQQTAIGQDPQAVSTLLIINSMVEKYGKSVGEGAYDFDIEVGGQGLLVNGQPFEG